MPKIVDVDLRRDELALAAARVIARRGIAAASLRQVAAEAGWTTGTLAHYFDDKAALLRFTLEASLTRRREGRPDEPVDPLGALRHALVAALPLDDDGRLHWHVTVAFCAQGDADIARLQRDAYRTYRKRVARAVADADLATGRDATRLAEELIAIADGIAMQALFDEASWSPRRQVDALDRALHRTGLFPVQT